MRKFTFLVSFKVLEILCVFYTHSTSQLGLATFQGLHHLMWLLETMLDSPALAAPQQAWYRGKETKTSLESSFLSVPGPDIWYWEDCELTLVSLGLKFSLSIIGVVNNSHTPLRRLRGRLNNILYVKVLCKIIKHHTYVMHYYPFYCRFTLMTCPRPHSQLVGKSRIESGDSDF